MRGAANLTSAMEVAADLRQRILHGELKPGARLKIDDIAALCDVSHMPVRVALQALEAEGVLDVYPHRGAVIKRVDARFVRNMLEVRAAIEVMLTEKLRAADRQGRARRARGARPRLRGGGASVATGGRSSTRTCACTTRSAASPTIPRRMRVLARGRLLIQALRVRYGFGPGRVEQVIAEHRALLSTRSRARTSKRAGEIARRHCEGARDELLALCSTPRRHGETSGRPAKNAARLSTHESGRARSRVACVPLAGVRRQHDVVEREQRLAARAARPRTRRGPRLRAGLCDQCVDETGLVDDRSARHIDEIRPRGRARR